MIVNGDCREVLAQLPANSVDSVVTDPPYHLTSVVKRFGGKNAAPAKFGTDGAFARQSRGFMGQTWDGGDIAFDRNLWMQVMRVLKPGGHLIAFSAARNYHRMACGIEDAGFEIRDQIMWLYGSGMPKSHDQGDGWGTALKPAHEPIVLARKPLKAKTVAANINDWGVGGINIDGCRIETDENLNGGAYAQNPTERDQMWGAEAGNSWKRGGAGEFVQPVGRFPANVIHDGSEEVVDAFPTAPGQIANESTRERSRSKNVYGDMRGREGEPSADSENKGVVGFKMKPGARRLDNGSAARFFYCAKASKADREEGNDHPTVKPTDLMRYLCRLITPAGGTVLDPFAGSGSTGKAAALEGFKFIGIELDSKFAAIAAKRSNDDVIDTEALALIG